MIVEPTPANLARAAWLLRQGGLVVMPTETVYGLAADATHADAVRRVFAAKGRPAENPLIVHVAEWSALGRVAVNVPDSARALAERFWPGPLTVVLERHPDLPAEVAGGGKTVAVRMPRHPVALALLREVQTPLAAPSANRFMGLSPTRAEHVDPLLAEIVLDGGPCEVGLESTVVDVTGPQPRLLRPGGVSRADLEQVLGRGLLGGVSGERRSPGQYPRHYAPKAPLRLVAAVPLEGWGLSFTLPTTDRILKMPADPRAYAAALYDALWKLDHAGADLIYVEMPPADPAWEAVRDRLTRAAM